MKTDSPFPWIPLACLVLLSGCATRATDTRPASPVVSAIESHRHVGDDDLLTAGLGRDGLRSSVAPAFADPASPTAAELRRRAIWSNWRGIADLAPGGGYGDVYGSVAAVPGSEYHAFARIAGASQVHRVMLQVPDSFDSARRCVLVSASSGSRGIYGAIALAGSWGLSHGCAVAYTDKGAGTGAVDTGTGLGYRLDGMRTTQAADSEFAPRAVAGAGAPIATKHANSGDNPEADWGLDVQQAARFALQVLTSTRANEPAYTAANTRVIAIGVSNGGGAVLRAAELPGDWLDGVVAVSPNILAPSGGRALYDYASEAALFMPCALDAQAFDAVALARPGGKPSPAGALRCQSLHKAGLLASSDASAQAMEALALLRGQGWSDAALSAGALSTAFDLWRSVLVTYASSYARTAADAMPCGYRFGAVDAKGLPALATDAELAARWSDGSGIPPGAGLGIFDAMATPGDSSFPGLQCLRALWTGNDEMASRLRQGVAATTARLPRRSLPIIVAHGASDGLIPEAFNSAAYVRWARSSGRDVRYWRVANAQHFDAFLGLPALSVSYVPMLPYAYRALDAMWSHLDSGKPLEGDADIQTHPRVATATGVTPLSSSDLGNLP